jgi:hypothetical protein
MKKQNLVKKIAFAIVEEYFTLFSIIKNNMAR